MVLTQFPHYVSVPEGAIIYLISLTIILIHSDFRAITDTSAVSRSVCMHSREAYQQISSQKGDAGSMQMCLCKLLPFGEVLFS